MRRASTCTACPAVGKPLAGDGTKPELFTAYLATSSQWDGDLNVLAQARTPVYFAIGAQDSYYGSDSFIAAYHTLRELYAAQGLTEEELAD